MDPFVSFKVRLFIKIDDGGRGPPDTNTHTHTHTHISSLIVKQNVLNGPSNVSGSAVHYGLYSSRVEEMLSLLNKRVSCNC